MAPVTNTPRMHFTWTMVSRGGAARYVIPPHEPLTLYVGLYVDRNLTFEAGYFTLRLDVFNNENTERFGTVNQYWAPDFRVFFAGTSNEVWIQQVWPTATQLTRGRSGFFFFRPFLLKQFIAPGGASVGGSQFAVAPEDHYFLIE